MTRRTKTKDATKLPLSIDDLRPADYNPRAMTAEAADGLRESIQEFGDIGGIVWNARSKHLVCGHQRVEQLTAAGATFHVEGGRPYLMCGDDRFNVRVVDWDLDTEQAANITANNPHIAGDFTIDVAGLLDGLRDIDLGQFERLNLDDLALDFSLPADADGQEYDESAADDVKMTECPSCGHKFPV